jgi:hypothetical protein
MAASLTFSRSRCRSAAARRRRTAHLLLDGDLARAEPKTLRYRLLHTSARLIKGGRCLRIRIPATWPWAGQLANAINTVLAITPKTGHQAKPTTPVNGQG